MTARQPTASSAAQGWTHVLASQAAPWAFVTGLLIPTVLIVSFRAAYAHSGWLIYAAIAMVATLVTSIAYWRSATR